MKDWQKDSCTTKAVTKIHAELGTKERKAVRLGPVLLGGNSEEEGNYTRGDVPWEAVEWFEPHIWQLRPSVPQREEEPPWLLGRPGA